jgi:hypothetical protein
MTRYLISFDDGAMDHVVDDLEQAAADAHDVLRDAKAAGVWVTGGGVMRQRAIIIGVDGSPTPGDFPERKAVIGGFSIIEVPTMREAQHWAARIAQACRCAQEIRVLMDDPEV